MEKYVYIYIFEYFFKILSICKLKRLKLRKEFNKYCSYSILGSKPTNVNQNNITKDIQTLRDQQCLH